MTVGSGGDVDLTRERIGATLLVIAGALVKLYLATRCALLADEAYFWMWSRRLDLGYFDQPPMIAWLIRGGTTVFGDTELGVRAPAVGCTLAIVPLLFWVKAPMRLATAWLVVPILGWFTGFATADAPLLGWWTIGLYGVLIGGNGWILAGVASGLAFESKYSGAALMPLAMLSVGREAWRDWRPWVGLLIALALAAPNLWWNAGHDWATFRFQFHEGLVAEAPPGIGGLVGWIGGQLGLTAGLAAVGAAWAASAPRTDRTNRVLLATSAPILLGFAAASVLAPSEAYWPDIAWVGVVVALCGPVGPRLARATELSLGLALLLDVIVVLHARSPLWPFPSDPASRLTEGPVIAAFVASWAAPTSTDGAGSAPRPVLTERYQEAAWVEFYAHIPARRWSTCGRRDQFSIWPVEEKPATGVFVRPFASSGATCLDADFPSRSPEHPFRGWDLAGRLVGDWELFELAPETVE